MLRNLKDLFDSFSSPAPKATHAREHTLQLVTAVLLVEVMRAEPDIGAAEQQAVISTLREKFSLADDELARLMDLAAETTKTIYDYHRFTTTLNDHFTHAQKIQVVENMWRVAYADAHLGVHENHLISKVAGLLHVTHGEYIAAKMRAREDAARA